MPFITTPSSFDYAPYYVGDKIARGYVVLQGALIWQDDDGDMYTVPHGFITDLASLPFFAGALNMRTLGRHQRGAVLHDYLSRGRIKSQTWADEQFYRAMIDDGEARWRARLMWLAVRANPLARLWWSQPPPANILLPDKFQQRED